MKAGQKPQTIEQVISKKPKDSLLDVIGFAEPVFYGKTKNTRIKCKCICGNITIIFTKCFIDGNTKSCGCLHKKRKLKYSVWSYSVEIFVMYIIGEEWDCQK